MPFQTSGLHHITATTGGDQDDLDFFAGTLGLALVKQTVNFDDPGVYHFYYADAAGTPGSIMTTFPYGHRGTRRGLPGAGLTSRVVFSAPADARTFWTRRLGERGAAYQDAQALGRPALWTTDPSGLPLAIAFGDDARDPSPGLGADVALRGILGVQFTVLEAEPVAEFLRDEFGMATTEAGSRGSGRRVLAEAGDGGPGRTLEVVEDAGAPEGKNGIGTVHHVAFRAPSDDTRDALRERLDSQGVRVTETRDRTYFRSIYFRDARRTGGVLFEVATDDPGFDADEDRGALGAALRLPPGLEDEDAVRRGLPDITVPTP
ncbi:VOC family protein [Rubrivirga sp.]|uniref:VOC family protein n=1 Tax=Rubrivirga sp. TaxID=1885344 RepID=UPI003C74EEBB